MLTDDQILAVQGGFTDEAPANAVEVICEELIEARALLRYLPELSLQLEGARQEQAAMLKAHQKKWDGGTG